MISCNKNFVNQFMKYGIQLSNKKKLQKKSKKRQQQMKNQKYITYLQNLLRDSAIPFLPETQFYTSSVTLSPKPSQTQNQPILQHHKQTSQLEHSMSPELSGRLVERYSRQMLLKQISYEGQLKIVNSKIAIIGCGGIGCPLALYLAGAGVGTIGLFDSDSVDMTNLHRQIAHKNASIGVKKTQSLKQSLLEFNPNTQIIEHSFVTVQNCSQLSEYDFVIDGSDNPECRYIVNDFCMKMGKVLLSGACIGWEGQVTCYGGKQGPCYRCIWGNEQKTSGGCSTLGVVGMLPGFVGIILAIEALKLIINGQSSLEGNLLTYESKSATFRKCKLRPKLKDCIGCGQNKLDMNSYQYMQHRVCRPDLSNLPQVEEVSWQTVLQEKRAKKILDVRPSNQFQICHLKNMVNIPFETMSKWDKQSLAQEMKLQGILSEQQEKIYVSCNRGVMSKRACHLLNGLGFQSLSIKGGITEYSIKFDHQVPLL